MNCVCCKEPGHVEGFKLPIRAGSTGSTRLQPTRMFSSVRRQRKPLGHYTPESRIELNIEKAMFRNNAEVLRSMCDKKWKQKQKESQMLSVDNIFTSFHGINTSQHTEALQQQSASASKFPPEVRWLLTRSARLQRANNAGFAKYRNPVKDRVMSAGGGGRRGQMSLLRERSMCNRNESYDVSRMHRLQCDVLGPNFCTDCTEIKNKQTIIKEQKKNFPRLEVHTRSLVAPDRVEKMYLAHPQTLFHQKKSYECGCTVDPALEITTPLVYTPHEVFERIRRKKNIERGNELIRQEQELRKTNNNTPDKPSFFEEKTEPPMDMKVSVTFRHNDDSP